MKPEKIQKLGFQIKPRHLVEAGIMAASFAVPALMVLGDMKDGDPTMTLKEALLFIGALGGFLGVPLVVLAETALSLREHLQKLVVKERAKMDQGVLDAGVPVMGREETHE